MGLTSYPLNQILEFQNVDAIVCVATIPLAHGYRSTPYTGCELRKIEV